MYLFSLSGAMSLPPLPLAPLQAGGALSQASLLPLAPLQAGGALSEASLPHPRPRRQPNGDLGPAFLAAPPRQRHRGCVVRPAQARGGKPQQGPPPA